MEWVQGSAKQGTPFSEQHFTLLYMISAQQQLHSSTPSVAPGSSSPSMGPSAKKTGKMLLYVLLTNNFSPLSFNYNTASNYDITACKYPHLKMKHKLGNYFPFPSESSLFPSHLHQVGSSALPSATNDKTKERSLKHPLRKLKTRYSRIYWALKKQQSEKHLLFLFKVFASFP